MNKLHKRIPKQIISPSSEIINKHKFDFMIYPVVINLMSDAKYKGLIYHVRDKKCKIFHMKDASICMVNPERLWSDASWICHKLKSINVF